MWKHCNSEVTTDPARWIGHNPPPFSISRKDLDQTKNSQFSIFQRSFQGYFHTDVWSGVYFSDHFVLTSLLLWRCVKYNDWQLNFELSSTAQSPNVSTSARLKWLDLIYVVVQWKVVDTSAIFVYVNCSIQNFQFVYSEYSASDCL